jgi:hypothetical protein
MLDSEDSHQQNVRERIARDGPGAELLRQAYVKELKSHMDAFYEHGSLADVLALCEAFERLDCREYGRSDLHRARLVEELAIFGRCPRAE